MIDSISNKHNNKKLVENSSKAKDLEAKIKREEKLLEDEIYEMSRYIKAKLALGLDIFRIELPDSAFEMKKIIFFILNKIQRKLSDNIVLRQYLVSYPDFIDTLKLREQLSDPKELLLKISQHLKKEEIYQDNVIFYNGQLGKSFYLILEGEVAILLPYEYKIKITDKQLFKYMSFLLQHKDHELIRLILDSNSMVINDEDYGDNELYIKFKSVVDKALPLYTETEKISSQDYIKRYNFFEDIENKSIFEKLKKIKEKNKKEENKENKKDNDNKDNKDNKDYKDIKDKKENINKDKNAKKNNKDKDKKDENDKNKKGKNNKDNKDKKEKEKQKSKLNIENKETNEEENDEEVEGDTTKRNKKNFFYNIETVFTVWKYFEVVRLSKGKCFGELALQKEGKKRTATIITTQNSVFGILQKDVYQMFIKETMDKARKTNVELLLKSKLFKGCNSEKFENHYFNCFKFMKKYKGEYLFRQGEQRTIIYFIKKGEVQIELFSNCFNIDNIVENLGYPEENLDLKELIKSQKKIELFCKENRKFNVLIFSGDAIGLNDHIISDTNEELAFSGLCVTYCELFALDKKFFNKMMDDKIIRNNFNKMVKERKERLSERLLQLRSNIILQYYNFIKDNIENYKNYNNKNYFDEGNIINKKKEFKKFINQDNIVEINNNTYDENNNKGIFYIKKNDNNFNKTMGQFHLKNNNNQNYKNNNSIQNLNIENFEKKNKTSNLLNTENNFNKSKNRINHKSKTNNKISIKALNIKDTLSRNQNLILKPEDSKTADSNKIKVNFRNIQNEHIIKEISKFSNSFIKNDTQRSLRTPRYQESNEVGKKEKIVRNISERKGNLVKKQKSPKINNIENFINFGNFKLQKLLLKQSFVYNTEIDKIDKIIMNNYDKVSPLSCKILINKEKAKKKIFEEMNTEPNLQFDSLTKNKFILYNNKEKEKQYALLPKNENENENKIKKRNNISLPMVLSKINVSNSESQYPKEIYNILKNKKLKSVNKK